MSTHATLPRTMRETRWAITKDSKSRLPEARLVFTCAVGGGLRGSVVAAHLALGDSEEPATRSVTFDDDRIRIDFTNEGRVRAIEFQARKTPAEVPEFAHFAMGFRDTMLSAHFLRVAFDTVMCLWLAHEIAFDPSVAKPPESTSIDDEPMKEHEWVQPMSLCGDTA